jgi:hypothetical protein
MANKKFSEFTEATTLEDLSLAGLQDGDNVIVPIELINSKPYRVYTALLTQTGESSPADKVQGDSLEIGVSYTIVSNTENANLTSFGAPNSNVGTSFVCTTAGVLPSIGSINLSYDTAAPVVTVLENTIGNVYWSYIIAGGYSGTIDEDLVTEGKQVVFSPTLAISRSGGKYFIAIENIPVDGIVGITITDGTDFINGGLENFPIEIRVYN